MLFHRAFDFKLTLWRDLIHAGASHPVTIHQHHIPRSGPLLANSASTRRVTSGSSISGGA